MKLREMSTDKAFDVIADLTPHICVIAKDEKLLKKWNEKLTIKEGTSVDKIKYMGIAKTIDKIGIIVPVMLKKYRPQVYGILSVMNEREVSEIEKQSPIETTKQLMELFEDEDIKKLFQSA